MPPLTAWRNTFARRGFRRTVWFLWRSATGFAFRHNFGGHPSIGKLYLQTRPCLHRSRRAKRLTAIATHKGKAASQNALIAETCEQSCLRIEHAPMFGRQIDECAIGTVAKSAQELLIALHTDTEQLRAELPGGLLQADTMPACDLP